MDIAIVGAGPRGLLILDQLVRKFSLSYINYLDINIFDRYKIGGRVWQINQYRYLKMDTICQQITMFKNGDGPNLYQWIKTIAKQFIIKKSQLSLLRKKQALKDIYGVSPNDFVPRYLYGMYLQWFYKNIYKYKSDKVKIYYIQHFIYSVSKNNLERYVLTTANYQKYLADKVIFNLGQEVNRLSGNELRLYNYTQKHQLYYSPLGYVEEKRLANLKPRKNVIIRGLGLDFADCVNILSLGRGGRYVKRNNGLLVYHQSGKEPYIIAGSRTGLPYYCKARNQKINGQHPQPYFLSKRIIKRHLIDNKMDFNTFLDLVKLDMELFYYTRLISIKYHSYDAKLFSHHFKLSHDPQSVIDSYNFHDDEKFNLGKIVHPFKGYEIKSISQYQELIEKWLTFVIRQANQGNLVNPYAAAFEVLRDGRNNIRYIIDNGLLSNDDYYHKFLSVFNRLNSRLVMGPPALDLNRYRALIKSGILTILPPHLKVDTHWLKFRAYSTLIPKVRYKAKAMIEARNPVPNVFLSSNPLIINLIKSGLLSPAYILVDGQQKPLKCANVKNSTDQMINSNGILEPNLFIWGLSTEGIHWCTPNSPHTSGKDINLLNSEKIAKNVLNITSN